jgi:glycosyltransferase involved in cell wall biosynthesis
VSKTNSVAILIATRNRPVAVRRLLDSVLTSSIQPQQVIIVSSGQNIGSVISEFAESLPIVHNHTESIGQITQKRIGVKMIAQKMNWCVFLDDDLVLDKNALKIAIDTASAYPRTNVIGIGLGTPVTSRGTNLPVHLEILARLFQLSSNKLGKVLRSGHASSYLQSKCVIETQWLNGASIWRTRYARDYGKGLPSTPYAACEDLIFSYPLSKNGTLIYVPEARVNFQETELSNVDSFRVIEAASLWRFYFVSKYKELSLNYFFLSQIIRTIYAVVNSGEPRLSMFGKLIKLNWKMFKCKFTGRSPEVLLSELML